MTGVGQGERLRVFFRIGIYSFGGPAAQIALMHRELVDERDWLTEDEFLSALSFCMLLPGPEAMQLATYAGWRLDGVRGGLVAGLLFVVPGALFMALLATVYAIYGNVPLVEALFLGVQATVVAIVLEALLKVARKALKGSAHWIIAALSFVAIFALHLPFPLIVAAAALFGFLTTRGSGFPAPAPANRPNTLGTIALWLAIWLLPIAVLWAMDARLLTEIALFFSKLAVVTFGGAYAVLAYMTQTVVVDYGWISTRQMIDGLGLAETTPGPLILVTEFVGFLAGYTQGGLPLALAAAVVTLWVTFVPCFLWIFTGAPYIERLTHMPRLKAALAAVTAAVVGVILNLSLWFALHVVFRTVGTVHFGVVTLIRPEIASFDIGAFVISVGAAILLLGLRIGIGRTLAAGAVAGLLLSLVS
jgi:chromate transporter